MDLIIKNRGYGKTTDLIKESAKTGYRILTPNTQTIEYILSIANKLGLTIPQPYVCQSSGKFSYSTKEPVLIDELDTFIEQILGYRVVAATLPSEKTRVAKGSMQFLDPILSYGPQFKIGQEETTDLNKTIKNVIFNNPATIVCWKDGSKTVVMCQDGDTYSEELGLAMCIVKKLCNNKGNYNDVFKKWLPKEE